MTSRMDIRIQGAAWHEAGTIIDVHIEHSSMSIGESLSRDAAIILRDALNQALDQEEDA